MGRVGMPKKKSVLKHNNSISWQRTTSTKTANPGLFNSRLSIGNRLKRVDNCSVFPATAGAALSNKLHSESAAAHVAREEECYGTHEPRPSHLGRFARWSGD